VRSPLRNFYSTAFKTPNLSTLLQAHRTSIFNPEIG
jgi:hypothetical protein